MKMNPKIMPLMKMHHLQVPMERKMLRMPPKSQKTKSKLERNSFPQTRNQRREPSK